MNHTKKRREKTASLNNKKYSQRYVFLFNREILSKKNGDKLGRK